jgi:hypothetical protein
MKKGVSFILLLIMVVILLIFLYPQLININNSPRQTDLDIPGELNYDIEYVKCGEEKDYDIKGPISGIGAGGTENEAKERCRANAVIGSSPHEGCLFNKCDNNDGCKDGAKNIGGEETTYDCFEVDRGNWECSCTIHGDSISATVYCTPCDSIHKN